MTSMLAMRHLLCLFFVVGYAVNPGPVQSQDIDVGVILCREGGVNKGKWDRNVLLGVGRALTGGGTIKSIGVKTATCEADMPDATCFAAPQLLRCRTAAIERILKASAWMAAQYVLIGERDYEDFRRAAPRAVMDGFAYGDGRPAAPEIETLVERMRSEEVKTEGSAASDQQAQETQALAWLYATIADLNLAALIGHEVAHMFEEKCPIARGSLAEENKRFDMVKAGQLKGALFCPRNPDLKEVKADLCALRHIRSLKEGKQFQVTEASAVQTFALRAAADMVSFQLLAGWRYREGVPEGKFAIIDLPAYLYPAYRILLFASELQGDNRSPVICGESSSLFVHATQEAFKRCSDKAGGIVGDDILALLPAGVATSWNGAPWTIESYSCR